jgi:hypothetical protein
VAKAPPLATERTNTILHLLAAMPRSGLLRQARVPLIKVVRCLFLSLALGGLVAISTYGLAGAEPSMMT